MRTRDHKDKYPRKHHALPSLGGRVRIALICILLLFVALIGRAVYLQGFDSEFLQGEGARRYKRHIGLPGIRGKIYDRSGNVVLASSVLVKVVGVDKKLARRATKEQLEQVGALIEVPLDKIQRAIASSESGYAYLKRQVDLETAAAVMALKVPGISTEDEYKRIYPEGETVSQIVGITDIDGKGKEGLELALNEQLEGRAGFRGVLRDKLGQAIEATGDVELPEHGQDVHLTLDAGIQYDVYEALIEAMKENNAAAASAVVVDVQTGGILSLVNLPTYDPSQRSTIVSENTRNRALTDTFEPGSTMKPFTVALALDIQRIGINTKFNTGNGKYRYEGHTISDVSRHNGVLDAAGILRRSSNIGMTMISERMASEEMWQMFTALGFGHAPNVGLPGAVSGRLRPWDRWRPIERATMAYGYGLSVSLIQLAQAYTVFARDGDMVPVSLLKREQPSSSQQVFKPEVARAVRDMLEEAAGPEGARLAQVQGYRVAGKSGTARKIIDGRYSQSRYRSSFVGFAPASNPRIVVAVTIDEPQGHYFGGRVAAPVFADIVASTLRRLEIEPDEPVDVLAALSPDQENKSE